MNYDGLSLPSCDANGNLCAYPKCDESLSGIYSNNNNQLLGQHYYFIALGLIILIVHVHGQYFPLFQRVRTIRVIQAHGLSWSMRSTSGCVVVELMSTHPKITMSGHRSIFFVSQMLNVKNTSDKLEETQEIKNILHQLATYIKLCKCLSNTTLFWLFCNQNFSHLDFCILLFFRFTYSLNLILLAASIQI